ncbi:MAG: hypothetical protein ACTHU0_37745 [Kofleriaceae bacterium]
MLRKPIALARIHSCTSAARLASRSRAAVLSGPASFAGNPFQTGTIDHALASARDVTRERAARGAPQRAGAPRSPQRMRSGVRRMCALGNIGEISPLTDVRHPDKPLLESSNSRVFVE